MEFDEKVAIREQERQAKIKKRKKHKKIKVILLCTALVGAIALTWYVVRGKKLLAQKAAEKEVEIVVGNNQSVRYARIDTINGNEMSVTYLAEKTTEEATEERPKEAPDKESDKSEESGERPDKGSRPEGFGGGSFPGQGGEMPEGFDGGSFPSFDGEMPEGFDGGSFPSFGGDMPEGFGGGSFPGGGSRSEGSSDKSASRKSSNTITIDGQSYELAEETEITYIPVGTVVTTKLGTETTFSRLQAGDYIAIVTESDGAENVIVAVYIVA
ncbi:MAG: hypothetical protein IK018_10020 [Lachnospiraceae bacterium]|nr:hypothetical protein [Lachnospiraceae bacterium]MBR5994131.1 hypothetical protein [Lachnospiraceae bacterium]